MKSVLIMAGGTGGHIFPGLAVANYLRDHNVSVHWLGTSQGLEARLVPEAGFPLHLISIHGLRGKRFTKIFSAPYEIMSAVMESRRIINELKPDVVIGMGGFVSGPGGIASWLLRKPLIIHEQNAKAGLTNKILSKFAKKIVEGFPGAFKPSPKIITLGNPVRAEIENLPPPTEKFKQTHSRLRLLILGGSLGAKALNQIVPAVLKQLPVDSRPEVWHQTGAKLFDETQLLYQQYGLHENVRLVPFIDDMAAAYRWADVVLCRAGASTVAELCAAGLGGVLVPYPYAVDDHQTANADYMVKGGAALCVQQSALTEDKLTDIVKKFTAEPQTYMAMANAAYLLRKTDVVKNIVKICEEGRH